jgi:hypothetical protein
MRLNLISEEKRVTHSVVTYILDGRLRIVVFFDPDRKKMGFLYPQTVYI